MKRDINSNTVVIVSGFGLALIGLFLPYAVKKMPSWISIPLIVIGAAMVVGPLILLGVQRLRGVPDRTDATQEDEQRIGIDNYGDMELEDYSSGEKLDRGIVNRRGGRLKGRGIDSE